MSSVLFCLLQDETTINAEERIKSLEEEVRALKSQEERRRVRDKAKNVLMLEISRQGCWLENVS